MSVSPGLGYECCGELSRPATGAMILLASGKDVASRDPSRGGGFGADLAANLPAFRGTATRDFMERAPNPNESTERIEAREALLAARTEMLEEAGGYFTSEEIGAALGSQPGSFSQRMTDARQRVEVLGVAYLDRWCYPRFQFIDSDDFRPYPEMQPILQALKPDHMGGIGSTGSSPAIPCSTVARHSRCGGRIARRSSRQRVRNSGMDATEASSLPAPTGQGR